MKSNINNTIKALCFAALPLLGAACLSSCQDKDYESFPTVMKPISSADVEAKLVGDDYVITWGELPEGTKMQVSRYVGNTINSTEIVDGTKYVHEGVETNVDYTYVLKTTDGSNVSKGIVLDYTRPGASRVQNVTMSQVDKTDGYDAMVSWDKCSDATKISIVATNGSKEVKGEVNGNETSWIIPNVTVGEEWQVKVVAVNDKGNSLTSTAGLKIGKTMIGFLTIYDTPEELEANGDDDEASAWLWLHSEYPTAKFVPFSSIASADDLEQFRVLFWLRDIETGNFDDVFNYPEVVMNATPYISQWYKDGGSVLLWSHACPYIEQLGRLPIGTFIAPGADCACGTGTGWNGAGDDWVLAVSAYPGDQFKIDFTSHPIYRGFDSEIESRDGDTWKAIHMLGPGWREDHNCLFFNLPGKLTDKGNQDKACYDLCTSEFGIYPLGTWDGQRFWIGQLNVWEAQQGNTDCKGTVICIGNGGCEFSQNNPDGSKDVRAYPKNNIYQHNILRLAKNSLEYLKTR